MDIPEEFAGNQLFSAIEVTMWDGRKAVTCVSGEVGGSSKPKDAAKLYESLGVVFSTRVLVTLEGLSEEAVLVCAQQAPLLARTQGLTRHAFLQLLVVKMQ